MSADSGNSRPWYAGKNQDALFYLLIAVLFIEFIVGGIAFFYGIMHARPEVAGGPPIARFPWLYWALAAILAPVGLLLIVHLTGTMLSATLKRENGEKSPADKDSDDLPQSMRRFYAAVRHAPTVIILLAILLLGAMLFYMDGAFAFIKDLCVKLLPYIPWLAGSLAALLSICFITRAIMIYRQRKMENEYAWRREVLEKTGLVLMDRSTRPLSLENMENQALPPSQKPSALNEARIVLDVEPRETDEGENKKEDK